MHASSTRARKARLEHYVWALAAIALVAAASVGWIFHRLLDDVSRRRDRTTAQFDAARESNTRLQSEIFAVKTDLDHILERNGVPMLLDYQHGRDALDRCRTVLSTAPWTPEQRRPLTERLDELGGLLDRAYHSKVESRGLDDASQEAERIARKRIADLHARVEVLAGTNRLENVAWLLRARGGGTPIPRPGDVGGGTVRGDFANVRSEVADLTGLTLRLSLEPELDNLVDIKENGILQSLKRLKRMLAPVLKDPRMVGVLQPDSVSNIETALLGRAPVGGPGEDEPRGVDEGLYALRCRSLAERTVQEELASDAGSLTDRAREDVDALAELGRVGFVQETQDTERALRRAQLMMGAIASSALVMFLAASYWISAAIRRQVHTLHGTLRELHAVNEAHESALSQVSILSAAMRAASSPMLIADRESRVQWVNPAYCTLRGWDETDTLSTVQDVRGIVSEGAPSPEDILARLARGETWQGEGQCLRSDGEARIGDQTVTPVLDKAGQLSHYISIVHDVTEERLSAEALRASHDETTLVLKSVASILIGFTPDARVRRWTPQAEEVLGTPAVDAQGARLAELRLSWDTAKVEEAIVRCCRQGREVRLDDVPFTRPDVTSGVLAISLNPMRDAQGAVCGCVLLGRDITDRRHLEQQLSRAQKLESIGQLAAGIAHEINTPTQFISDNTRFVRDSVESLRSVLEGMSKAARREAGPALNASELEAIARDIGDVDFDFLLAEIPRALDDSIEGLERIRNIVQAMKQFSHPGTGQKDPADLNQMLRVTSTVARNEWKYTATLDLELDPTLPLVPCYEQDLSQVVLNMIVNASHAIAERKDRPAGTSGRIVLQTSHEGDYAIIRVRDDGNGIPEAIRHRIFDPFFTTKGVGKGTGQGLAIAHSVVVDKHQGTIELDSEVGRGTQFTIRLPIHPETEAANAPQDVSHAV